MHIFLPGVRSKDGEAVDFSFEEKLSDCFNDFIEGGSLKLELSVSASGDKILVDGTLEVLAPAQCSRCLVSFDRHFKTDFREVFSVLEETAADEKPDRQAEDTANSLTISGDNLYLDEYIRQLIILAQDYDNPLCSPDCEGLCSGCGVDLNKSKCSCELNNKPLDARLLKLREFESER